jgi:putative component of membrane protein insertase Oxa1/YidC/SpoIIIJ protein YidD
MTKSYPKRFFTVSSVFLLIILFYSKGVYPAERSPEKKRSLDEQSMRSFFSIPFLSIVSVYRDFSGKAKPSLCNMHPSCSTYALDAVNKKGPFIGTLKTIDRLNRCGHDVGRYKSTWTERGVKYSDPVEN